MTVGIVSGRGSGRDQLGRGNAAPGLGYVADSQIVLGFPVRSQAWLDTGRFPILVAGFENRAVAGFDFYAQRNRNSICMLWSR